MNNEKNKDIYEYASEINPKATLLTFYDVFSVLLKDIDCVVCLTSASDLLGYSDGGFRHCIHVYSTQELHLPYLDCILVKSLEEHPYIDYHGIKVTPIEVAINEMLEDNFTDEQVLYETFATYYFENNNSYDGLNIPKELLLKANTFKDGGKHYYDSY